MSKSKFLFNFNVKEKLDSIVAVSTYVPDDSFSAEFLGAERSGHGIVIGDGDLIVTIGYVITEAETIWISANGSDAVPGYIVGNDYESGLGLIKPMSRLNLPIIECGKLANLSVGNPVLIAGHGGLGYMKESNVSQIEEFTGRWEYILDQAIYTSPVHPNWAGAALIGDDGRLYGVGCLLIQEAQESEMMIGQNMFVPIDTIFPNLDEIIQYGARKKLPRPWLGLLLQEEKAQLVVTGIFTGCPADKAGLELGDKITAINNNSVSILSLFFRELWSMGDSGVDIPLTIQRDSGELRIVVKSSDRETSFRRGPVN
jgi:S1-C subfamily serine protease